MSQTAPRPTAGPSHEAVDTVSAPAGSLRLAAEPAPAVPVERRAAPRKRATRAEPTAVIDLAAAERDGVRLDGALEGAVTRAVARAVQEAVERGLQAQLPGLLDVGLLEALGPLSGEVATAFADVEFSVQRTAVLETRAGVAESRATSAEQRARTAEDRLDGTRARAALLEDQVTALKAQVSALQAQVREQSERSTGLFRRRRR